MGARRSGVRSTTASRSSRGATTHKLGRYPHLKLKEARDAARVFLADPQKGLARADTGSFREVAENFVKRHVAASKLRSQPEIERCLKVYIYPAWEGKPFRELTRDDVAELLDDIEDQHGARQADLVLAIIRKMVNWYATRTDYVPPIVRGMRRYKPARQQGHALAERRRDPRAVEGMRRDGHVRRLMKTLLLTAQRVGKVATMQWDDLKDGVWTISKESKREKSTAGTLRLPPMALAIINAQPRLAGNPYVFAGRGGGPFNSFASARTSWTPSCPTCRHGSSTTCAAPRAR